MRYGARAGVSDHGPTLDRGKPEDGPIQRDLTVNPLALVRSRGGTSFAGGSGS